MQHVTYPAQLALKEEILTEALQRAHLEIPGQTAAMPSPAVFGYRHRLRLHLDQEGKLGFHQTGSNRVVSIARCLLATEAINRGLGLLVEGRWPERLKAQVAGIELMECPASGRLVLVLEERDGQGSGRSLSTLPKGLSSLADSVLVKQPRAHAQPSSPGAQVLLAQDFHFGDHSYRL